MKSAKLSKPVVDTIIEENNDLKAKLKEMHLKQIQSKNEKKELLRRLKEFQEAEREKEAF
jgi:hypothetical protein